MVKVIAFDFGGVIGSDADEWQTTFIKINKITGLTADELQELFIKHWPDLKVGRGNIENFWTEVAKRSHLDVDPKVLRKIYNENITANGKLLSFCKTLKRKYKLVILSNNTKDWMDEEIGRFKLNSIFEKIYSSADLGISKPSREIFEYVFRDLGVKPQEIIFIDNQENNIEAAQALGINTILFRNLDQLKKDLSSFLAN